MNRRRLLQFASALAGGAVVGPGLASAAAQLESGAILGVDWGLAFADVDADVAPAPMQLVSGACPERLAGRLYRNGPAKFRRPGGSAAHWFDGDGLVRVFTLRQGAASLAARFVDTAKRRADSAARAVVTPGFGTAGRGDPKPGLTDACSAANTSVLAVGGAVWALWSQGPPIALEAGDLSTRGPVTLRADLAHAPFLARPRPEPDGDVWNLGLTGDKAVVWRLGRDGVLISADTIDLPCASYVGDFTATQRHLILILTPLIQDHAGATFIDGFTWRPKEPTRILVIDKADLESRRLYDLPAVFASQFGPAWAEVDGTIRFDACVSDDPGCLVRGAREVLTDEWTPAPAPRLGLISLSPDGSADLRRADLAAAFPGADPSVAGWPRAHTIHLTGAGAGPLFHGVAVHDWKADRSDAFDFGPAHLVDEAVFAPRPGGAGELDGWLLVPSLNLAAKATELHVFEAGHVASGPLCTWRAATALPASLYGVFVSG